MVVDRFRRPTVGLLYGPLSVFDSAIPENHLFCQPTHGMTVNLASEFFTKDAPNDSFLVGRVMAALYSGANWVM